MLPSKNFLLKGAELIMTQKLNDIDIEIMEKMPEVTPYAGALPFMKMCEGMGLPDIINENLNIRGRKGYKDSDHILSIATMQICGGSTVDDLEMLKQNLEVSGSPFKIPSPTAARNFMNYFHDEEEAKKHKQGQSYIPQMNEHLTGFNVIHANIFQQSHSLRPKAMRRECSGLMIVCQKTNK